MVNLAKYTKSSWILWENTVLFLRQTREKISTLDFFDNVSITLPLNWGPNQKRKRSHDISGHKRETTWNQLWRENMQKSSHFAQQALYKIVSKCKTVFCTVFFFKYLISVYCLIFLCMILSTLTLLNSILDFGAQVLNLQQNLRNHPTKNSGLKNRRYYR